MTGHCRSSAQLSAAQFTTAKPVRGNGTNSGRTSLAGCSLRCTTTPGAGRRLGSSKRSGISSPFQGARSPPASSFPTSAITYRICIERKHCVNVPEANPRQSPCLVSNHFKLPHLPCKARPVVFAPRQAAAQSGGCPGAAMWPVVAVAWWLQ